MILSTANTCEVPEALCPLQASSSSGQEQEVLIPYPSGMPLPDYISPEDLQRLQAGNAVGKQGPPGFEQKEGAFGSIIPGNHANGVTGPSNAGRTGLIEASPVRQAREPYQPGLANAAVISRLLGVVWNCNCHACMS